MTESIGIADVTRSTRTTSFKWNGKDVEITYDPNLFTPAAEAEWQQMQEDGAWVGTVGAAFVQKLIKDWNLLGDVVQQELDGEPQFDKNDDPVMVLVTSDEMFPLDVDKLRYLPNIFIDAVVTAVGEDIAPKARRRRS